jgi:hypothetical protein
MFRYLLSRLFGWPQIGGPLILDEKVYPDPPEEDGVIEAPELAILPGKDRYGSVGTVIHPLEVKVGQRYRTMDPRRNHAPPIVVSALTAKHAWVMSEMPVGLEKPRRVLKERLLDPRKYEFLWMKED